MNWRRGIRAVLVGAITLVIALIYVPQCPVRVYAENAEALSFALAATVTFIVYRFK